MAKSIKQRVKTQSSKHVKVKRTVYEKQVIKEINQLNYNIRRRLVNVEKHDTTAQYSTIKNKFVKLDKSVAGKSAEALERLRNKLRYLNSLKSTSVKGMKKAKKAEKKAEEYFEDLREKAGIKPTDSAYNDTKDIRNLINEIYNKLLEEGGWWEKGYSSAVRGDIETMLTSWYASPEEIIDYLRKKLDHLYETGEYEPLKDTWEDENDDFEDF